MLLFLTRDALCKRSMDDLLVGDGDGDLWLRKAFSERNRLGVPCSRLCQNSLGDEFPSEALNGED
jgi:hypothetical protein